MSPTDGWADRRAVLPLFRRWTGLAAAELDLDDQGPRAVVGQRHRHVGAEHAGRHDRAAAAECGDDRLDECSLTGRGAAADQLGRRPFFRSA